MSYRSKLIITILFAIAMAYFEAAVVVYLRALFYPEGFSVIVKNLPAPYVKVELWREAVTIIMLFLVAWLAGRRGWERFGYFAILFGVWDIFYYVWLNVAIGWPSTLTDWDILFLLPVPWVGPVIAPVAVSILLIITGIVFTRRFARERRIHPPLATWIMALVATGVILYSFMRDAGRVTHGQMPEPYAFWALGLGLLLYIWALVLAVRKHDGRSGWRG